MYLPFSRVEKSFKCGNRTFTIKSNPRVLSSFILSCKGASITKLIAIECNEKIYLIPKRPSWTFWNPFNRAAIKEAIRILEDLYRRYGVQET